MSRTKEVIVLKLWGAVPGSKQNEFERRAVNLMNIKAGMFAIDTEQNRYVNGHIRWLWTQFQKGE